MKRYINGEYLLVNDNDKVIDWTTTEAEAIEVALEWMKYYVNAGAGDTRHTVTVYGGVDADGRSYRLVFDVDDVTE